MSEAVRTAEVRARLARIDLSGVVARYSDLIAAALLIWGLLFYLNNIDGWLINDDEGSYLYAAWRISQGELPYRDFLTPQLPVFLYSGALLIKLLGPSVLALRTVSAWLSVLSAGLLYLTARRLFRRELCLIAALAFLMHPDLYLEGRVYRPEPYMLFFGAAGLYAFVEAVFGGRRWLLVVAGLVFGLATLTKLFGFLPLAACVAFLGYQALRGERDWPGVVGDIAVLVVPYGLVVGSVFAGFYLATPVVSQAVFGHQLMQGRGLSRWAVFVKGLKFYVRYVQKYGLLVAFALPAAAHALVRRDQRRWLFAWQVPTALVFLLLSRELWPRHLLYLVPGLSVLFALALEPMLTWSRRSYLLLALVAGLTIPWFLDNRDIAWRSETGTWRLADYIAAHTAPDDYVLADYSGLNFYA
ncbi:MAG: ArnT family glycosyltransferase, partial [Anaerolineae bacterium]